MSRMDPGTKQELKIYLKFRVPDEVTIRLMVNYTTARGVRVESQSEASVRSEHPFRTRLVHHVAHVSVGRPPPHRAYNLPFIFYFYIKVSTSVADIPTPPHPVTELTQLE